MGGCLLWAAMGRPQAMAAQGVGVRFGCWSKIHGSRVFFQELSVGAGT